MTTYNNNFLTNVLARIDFSTPIFILKDEIPTELGNTCTKNFPILEPRDIPIQEIHIDVKQDEIARKQVNLKEWNFYGINREKRLCITSELMFVEFLKYSNFADLSEHFTIVLDSLFDLYQQLEAKRFGLRYINNISLSGRRYSWRPYLNKDLLSIFNVPTDKTKTSRAIHNLEINNGDYVMRFQYGMFNPDYPAPIKKKSFILDYDTYTRSSLHKEDIIKLLPIYHDEIELYFERSITDKLRGVLND